MQALVALGANLGDPAAQVGAAVTALERRFGTRAVRASSLWASRPVDCPEGSPDFVNAAVALEVTERIAPHALLRELRALELDHAPRAAERNAPRHLDVDLIAFGELQVRDAELELPHPRALARAFVMVPLAEVAPQTRWPGLDRTVEQLAGDLPPHDMRRISAGAGPGSAGCSHP